MALNSHGEWQGRHEINKSMTIYVHTVQRQTSLSHTLYYYMTSKWEHVIQSGEIKVPTTTAGTVKYWHPLPKL